MRYVALILSLLLLAVSGWALLRLLDPPPAPLPVLAEVPSFSLIQRDGSTVTRDDLLGAPWIADFIFTRCPGICPLMSLTMQRLGERLPSGSAVRLVSISVDPEFDTPEVLTAYAERFNAPSSWLFLTAEHAETTHELARKGFLLAVDPDPAPGTTEEPILHSSRLVLVDGKGRIRGYYDALHDEERERLLGDVERVLADEG